MHIWSFRYVNSGALRMEFGINSAGFRCKQGIYYCYNTNGYALAHDRLSKPVTFRNENEGIIHLILDVLEDKLLISKNDINKEYVVADNIDLYNNKYNMAVSGAVKDGDEIELISFKIIQR